MVAGEHTEQPEELGHVRLSTQDFSPPASE